ncbi:MAG: Dyp-type peroxidase [Thermoleophilia bacterium]
MDIPHTTRRSLIASAFTVGAAALLVQPVGLIEKANAAVNPACDPHATVDPFGIHQAGITTSAPEHLQLAAFDLVPGTTRQQLVDLLQNWQGAINMLTKGLPLPDAGDPDKAPADTGEALSQRADRLTITIGFGPSLFDGRFGLASQRPAALVDLPAFAGDALDAARSNGDLSVQCCSETRLVAEHALRTLARLATGRATVRWTQSGFNEPPTNPADGSGRNLLGFKDGTANLDATDAARMARNVWVDPSDGPAWLAGGTYQVYRRVLTNLREWDESVLSEQEEVFGRRRVTGAPFGGLRETDPVNNAQTPLTAHIRVANPRTGADSENERILRRGYSFHDGLAGDGTFDAGLAFVAYQRDPRRQFITMQTRLAANDALNEYITHTASAIFVIPPGTTATGYVGETLLGSAPARVTTPDPAADLARPASPGAVTPTPPAAPAPAPGGAAPRVPKQPKRRVQPRRRRPRRPRS